MRAEKRIDYIEIPVTDLKKAREFFSALFDWSFQEWGDDYMSFNDGQLDGGFRRVCWSFSSAQILSVISIAYRNSEQQSPNPFSHFLAAGDFTSSTRQVPNSQSGQLFNS